MPKLVILQAADNNFSGPLPVAFNSNLTILDFTNNSFTGMWVAQNSCNMYHVSLHRASRMQNRCLSVFMAVTRSTSICW